MRIRWLTAVFAVFYLSVLPAQAASAGATAPAKPAAEEPPGVFAEEGDEEGEASSYGLESSVNIREEYGFGQGRRQNIDSFLGEYENPFKPLPEESTYEGSRSESRSEINDARGI